MAAAIAPETIRDLAFGESDARTKAIAAIVGSGDPGALSLLQAVQDGDVKTAGDDRVLEVKGDKVTDLLTGKTVTPAPENLDDLVVNNRLRRELGTAIAALKLSSADRATRLAAAKELQGAADEDTLPAISTALDKEADPEIKGLLALTRASVQLASSDRATRLAAVRALAQSDSGSTKTLLLGVLERKGGNFVEPDAEVRAEAERSLSAVQQRLSTGEMIGRVFQRHFARLDPPSGSAGPRDHLRPDGRDQHGARRADHDRRLRHLRRAERVPPAFSRRVRRLSGLRDSGGVRRLGGVGMVLERTVIRFLYGRPLETLLATWGCR